MHVHVYLVLFLLSIVSTMDTLHWFLSLDPCFVLQKKAKLGYFLGRYGSQLTPDSFGTPRGNLS